MHAMQTITLALTFALRILVGVAVGALSSYLLARCILPAVVRLRDPGLLLSAPGDASTKSHLTLFLSRKVTTHKVQGACEPVWLSRDC